MQSTLQLACFIVAAFAGTLVISGVVARFVFGPEPRFSKVYAGAGVVTLIAGALVLVL